MNICPARPLRPCQPRKRALAVRINISIPETLATRAPDVLATHGFLGLSDYVQSCLRRDLGLDFVPAK